MSTKGGAATQRRAAQPRGEERPGTTLPAYEVADAAISRLSGPDLERLQGERLRTMLRYVYDSSGFWRRKLDAAGVGPDEIRGVEDLAALPFTTRAELDAAQAEHPPFGDHTCAPPETWTWFFNTSGTSGRRLKLVRSRRDWRLLLDWFRRYPLNDRRDLVIILGPIDGLLGPTASVEGIRGAGGIPVLAGLWDTRAKARAIAELRPAVVSGVPSYVMHLSEVAAELGIDLARCGVRSVHVLGEPGGSIPATRAALEERFGARIVDGYGLSEVWPLALSCPFSETLHLNEDFVAVECVDPETGEPVPEGEPGELVYTDLIGDSQPLLRYRSRDIARLIRSTPCRCGHAMARIERIEGRTDDMIWYRGVNFFPSAVEEVVRRHPGLAPEYRIVLDRGTASLPTVTIQVEALGEAPADAVDPLRESVLGELRTALGVAPQVDVLAPGALPRTERGKARRVVER
jgi:phenylacetate-CoA ligase